MHDHSRLAVRIAARFPINVVLIAHIQQTGFVGFDFRIEVDHGR
jgi:hypothetical protein